MSELEKRILKLADRPCGVSVSQLLESGLPVKLANKLFCERRLSIDLPINKNPVFRIIRAHKYAA
ncbi:hypothetical protein NNQ27_09960 [Cronobacter dublinensis subsp. infanticibi]|uniref:hypothetical protein n=1 Tax=Cronobacter dublinensis TaxID=413497 RepID=UPI0023DD2084|nr:hypothetical protein [Cronobacter dublinensis]WEP47191.1 hypothetical protein NNQ27_09960 [Cronobacter dublinensis]